MSETDEQIEQIEISIKQATELVDAKKSMLNLIDSPDFKKMIEIGYFEKEASRLVLLRADPNMQSAELQKTLDKQIDAVGYFRQYIGFILQMGRQAEQDIASDENTREEMLSENL